MGGLGVNEVLAHVAADRPTRGPNEGGEVVARLSQGCCRVVAGLLQVFTRCAIKIRFEGGPWGVPGGMG